MTEDERQDALSQNLAYERGKQPALIEAFGIRRLYGYRTISLSSAHAATILIAKNGTGKTTLIGALDAFLRFQLPRLRNLEFEEIFCKIRGVKHELTLTHETLMSFLEVPSEGETVKMANRLGVGPDEIFNFVLSDYKEAISNHMIDAVPNKFISKMLTAYGYDSRRIIRTLNEVYESLFVRNERLRELRETINSALDEHEVVYLPTYRRVELALTDEPDDRPYRRKRRPKISVSAGSLHTGDIQFGLADISDRLSELNRDIILKSNIGYRKISENIIYDLISGYELSPDAKVPAKSDLQLFFERLEEGEMMGPRYPINAPDLERVYSGEGVPEESKKFLSYFLGKLNEIVDITKSIERPVENFIDACNRYLSTTEPSTELSDRTTRLVPIDAKALRMKRKNLSVYVESLPQSVSISLDALSSGEKQMISLLAKLYLYPKKKIVLIDEPELSLSIDWQRGILVDVLLSPLCEQVVAITHSPFVFDNALEPFARSLTLSIEPDIEPTLTFDEGDMLGDGGADVF